MAIAELNKIDSRLTAMYANQVTTIADENFQDRSNLLFEHMQIIAVNNKMFLNLNK